jgi:hypothetical protein
MAPVDIGGACVCSSTDSTNLGDFTWQYRPDKQCQNTSKKNSRLEACASNLFTEILDCVTTYFILTYQPKLDRRSVLSFHLKIRQFHRQSSHILLEEHVPHPTFHLVYPCAMVWHSPFQ